MRPAITLLAVLLASPATAGEVRLQIRDGRVWMSATDATVGEILDVWARVGGTTVVNAEQLGGASLTLELNDVSEKQALDVVLRSASGYMAVNRVAGASGLSTFDRILILANSVAPREVAVRPAQPPPFVASPDELLGPTPGQDLQRLIGPDGLPVPDDQEDGPPPARFIPPVPFGFASGDAPPAEPSAPSPELQQPAPGVAVPGMIVPPPNPTPDPRTRP
jgi:hypothetical protein